MLIPSKHSGYKAGIRLYPGGGGKGGGGGSSAAAPDPALVQAQIRSMGYQDRAIQQMMDNTNAMQPLIKQQTQFGIDTAKTAYDQSQEDRKWGLSRRGELDGLQATQLKDAQDFNSGNRSNQMVEQAMQDVNSSFGNAQGMTSRALEARGINMNSGAAIAAMNSNGNVQAMAAANAANKTREAARQEGYSLSDRATNSRMGFQSQLGAGSAAGAGFGSMGLQNANSGTAGMNAGYNAAAGAAGGMGSNATGMYGAMGSYKNGQDQINKGDSAGDIMGGLGGLAMGGAKLYTAFGSDRRLKCDVEKVGSDSNTGLGLYEFSYIKDPDNKRYRGVMADEVMRFDPRAVVRDIDGFALVNYARLGLEMVEV